MSECMQWINAIKKMINKRCKTEKKNFEQDSYLFYSN